MSKINGGVVIHPGSYSDTKKGIETIVKSLDKIEFKDGYNLLLENCAGQGDTLARNFEELYGMLSSKNSKNINVCIDTAHIWGVGEYDISTEKGVEKLFTEFDKIIGLEKFKLLHLNDSRVNISSRKDCHEEIKNGYIWKTNDSSLKYLLHKVENLNIPFVLETTQDDFIKVYDLYRKLKD
jgi:deoxyribonuclease-4